MLFVDFVLIRWFCCSSGVLVSDICVLYFGGLVVLWFSVAW